MYVTESQYRSWVVEARGLELAILCGVIYIKPGHQVKELGQIGIGLDKLRMIEASSDEGGKIDRQEEKLKILERLIAAYEFRVPGLVPHSVRE